MGSVDSRGVVASLWFNAWSKLASRRGRPGRFAPGRSACAAAVRGVNVSLEPLETRQLLAGTTPFISEFMAVNNTTIRDADLDYSDWIELHNPGTSDVNLDGYYLTDSKADQDPWRLPAMNLPAGGYLLVFASGKDRAVAGQQLHTDFNLDGAGEYLALLAPDKSVLSEYDEFPSQLADISYGVGIDYVTTNLISPGGPTRYHVPTDGSAGVDWTGRTYDDSLWKEGPGGIGFEGPPGLPNEVEPNNDAAAANDAANGFAPVSGNVYHLTMRGSFGTSADWFRIGTLTAGDVVTITNSGTAGGRGNVANPALELWRGNAAAPTLVTNNLDDGPGQDALVYRFTVAADDTYYVHSVNPGAGATGSYEIGVWLENVGAAPTTTGNQVNEVEGNNNAGEATNFSTSWKAVNYRTQTQGQISPGSDADVFRYELAAGDRVSFVVSAAGALDARVSLLNASGQVVAVDDGTSVFTGAGGSSAIYSFLVGTAGTHYVRVASSNGSTGAYTLTAHLAAAGLPPAGNPYAQHIGTNVKGEMGDRTSAYVRLKFPVEEIDFDTLRLRIRYEDGFVAYLNGQEVARRNAPGTPNWSSSATGIRANSQAIIEEIINIPLDALVEGFENVLAIHGLNHAQDKADFLISASLEGLQTLTSVERYFQPATPGAANNPSGTIGVVADTTFSVDRGFFDAPISVEITTATPGAQVRYTTDGSEPTASSGSVYSGPITISSTTILRAAAFKPGHVSSNIDTQTYIFLNDVIRQPHNPANFPQQGEGNVHWDYGMDQRVVNDPAYSGRIIEAMKAIPSMSLVMEREDLFGSTGIYENPGGTGLNWEKPGSAELIYPDGSDGFQTDAGVRMYGGVSRATWYPKHTFRLLFKKQYGAGKLNFPLFQDGIMGDSAVEEFDTVILRGNFNKTWTFTNSGERTNAQYIHDSFISDTQLAMGQPGIHSTFVHLYVNGHYWGLYNPVERPDAAFAAAYMGGEKEEWDALNSSEPVDGVKTAWTEMQNIANGVAPGQPWSSSNPNPDALATPEAYAAIKEYLDVENLIDYFILNIWGGNIDWDDHNWYAARKREPGAGYKFFSWDAERTLESTTYDKTEVGGTFGQADKPSRLYKQLRANPEFRLLFADHVHKHFFNNGLLTPTVAWTRYKQLADVIDQAIIGESARWGDYQRPSQPYTRDVEWIAEQNRLKNVYFPVRTNNVLNQFIADGLYPGVAAPSFNQHGGEVAEGFDLSMTAPVGTIYYTLDGSDPRLPGGAIAPGAIAYSGPITLDATTIARARVLSNAGVWSALNQATFAVDTSALRVTEIMYNPAPPPAGSPYAADDFEFIELTNTRNRPIGLLGVSIPDIDYTFGDVTLAAAQRIVLVKNLAAFQSRYPGVAVGGAYAGSLDNAGERIQLVNARGRVFLDFAYDDDWYPHTDGGGYSLVAIDPDAASPLYGLKGNWRPSNLSGGGPGAADPGTNPGAVVVNEVMTHGDGTDPDWIELHNTTNSSINVGGWSLSDSALDLRKYRIAPDTSIPAKGYLVLYEDQHFGVAGNPGVVTPFRLDANGGGVYLSNADASGNVAGYRESVTFGAADRGVAFGRHAKSTGGSDFTAQHAPTPGLVNGLPRNGPVVINELMYNPAGTNVEYVELRNTGNAVVPLYDPQNPTNTWKFTNGITFAFPTGVSLPVGGSLLVVPIDPAVFRTRYNVHPHVQIFGPYTGALDNAGEPVELSKPIDPGQGATVPYVVVDRVNYEQAVPWPGGANGTGASLARRTPASYGNDAANWQAESAGSPGYSNFDTAPPVADILDVSPNPGPDPVDSLLITFDELVTDFDLGDLSLRRGDALLSLANATLTTTDGFTYTLGNLSSLTTEPGDYTLTLHVSTAGVRDIAGNDLNVEVDEAFTVAPQTGQITGTAGDDNYYAKRVGNELHVWANATGAGSPAATLPLPLSSAFTVSLGDGDDTLTIDMRGGDVELTGGVELLAGNGADRIRLVNGEGRTLTVGSVSLNGETLDLATADLRVLNTTAAAVEGLLKTARDGATRWQGPGIGATAAGPITGLVSLQSGADTLVKFSYNGDANGDGRVNADDYFRIDQAFLAQPANPLYAQGDFNFDETVNADDYFLIDQAFLGQGAPLVANAGPSPLFSTTAIAPPGETTTQPKRRTSASPSLFERSVRKVRRAGARR